MFNKENIGKMKKGAYLINTARGGICDRDAVAEALESGQLLGEIALHQVLPVKDSLLCTVSRRRVIGKSGCNIQHILHVCVCRRGSCGGLSIPGWLERGFSRRMQLVSILRCCTGVQVTSLCLLAKSV